MTVTLSFPGKTFMLGEYAALANLPAIMLATPPRFQCIITPAAGSVQNRQQWPLHLAPQDPCLRYYQQERQALGDFSFNFKGEF